MSEMKSNQELNQNTYDENSISVLEGLEAVRKRPGMYIGSTGKNGLHHCVYEVVDNAIDEAVNGSCDTINVIINENNSITIKDNGRGIPCGIHPKMGISTLEVVLSTLHAGGKFGQGGYKTSGGLHGVGSSVVNALSIEFEATVCRDGNIYQQHYSKGKKIDEVTIIGKTNKTGTTITFKPDSTIFNETKFDYSILSKRLKELALLNKKITIIFEDKRQGLEQTQTYHYKGGLKEFVKLVNKNKDTIHDEIIYIEKNIEDCEIEVAFQYTNNYNENLYSFVNNINTTEGGYHVNGFYNGLTKILNDFARENDYLKTKDENFRRDDIKEGLTSVVSIRIPEPEFEGQTKTKLGNTYVQGIVADAVKEYMEIFLIENKEIAEQIINKTLMSQQSRLASKKAKENTRKKNTFNRSKVKKLTDCTSNNPKECEIFLVEGDSAGGNAKQSRNREFQAILPQRGKSENVEKSTKTEMSQDLKNIEDALECGTGNDYNENKLKYWKVICMSDGDSDGAGHIVPLWLTNFYRNNKQLIKDGHVYIALPPLYKNVLKIEKGNETQIYYTYTEDEQIEYLTTNSPISISRYKGLGEMSAEQLWETTMNPKTRRLIQVVIKDEEEAEKTFTTLMGKKVEPRYEFIMKNAKFAKNIDI